MGLLDDIASVAPDLTCQIAFATFRLRDAVTNCMSVRRSSDNALADIGFAAADSLGFRDLDLSALASHVGAGSGFVATWYDQSANARDATQATAGDQPRVRNAGTNETSGGRVVPRTQNSGDPGRLQTGNFTIGAPTARYWVFFVFEGTSNHEDGCNPLAKTASAGGFDTDSHPFDVTGSGGNQWEINNEPMGKVTRKLDVAAGRKAWCIGHHALGEGRAWQGLDVIGVSACSTTNVENSTPLRLMHRQFQGYLHAALIFTATADGKMTDAVFSRIMTTLGYFYQAFTPSLAMLNCLSHVCATISDTGALANRTTGVTGTYTHSPALGSSGTWKVKAAKYGSLSDTYAVNLIGGGPFSVVQGTVPDAGISQATESTVAAYTTLETLDKFYDYLAYWETTSAGIIFDRLGQKNGAEIDLGTRNLVIDATAAAVFAYNSGTNTITIKASALAAGSAFKTFKTTGTASTANGATLGCAYTDAGGSRVSVSVTVQTAAGALVSGARVLLKKVSDGTAVLTGLTDASGQVAGTYVGATPLAVTGWARKASSPPYYSEGPLSGSITAAGFAATAILNSDE